MNLHDERVFVVGLAGPSGSGKTTVAERVAARLGGHVMSLETYTRSMSHLSLEQRREVNYDSPDVLDLPLITEHVRHFASGRAIEAPVYDFATHQRLDRRQRIEPKPLLIIAGILTLHYHELRPELHFSIYLDAPDRVCLHRRKVRDITERQRPIEFILWQYQETVLPMARQYLLPSKRYADAVIDGEPELPVVMRNVEQAIREAMAKRAASMA
jgi:uridine kinase